MIEDPTKFETEEGKTVNLNRVKTENLEKYVTDPEQRLELIMERQREDFQAAMKRRLERQQRAAQGLPDIDPDDEGKAPVA